jgi:tRNA(Ile)-lysidine synthase
LRGSKKVTDYLTDIKFENLHKGNVLVMCDASGKIICIPGLQVDNKVRVTEATTEILQISVL